MYWHTAVNYKRCIRVNVPRFPLCPEMMVPHSSPGLSSVQQGQCLWAGSVETDLQSPSARRLREPASITRARRQRTAQARWVTKSEDDTSLTTSCFFCNYHFHYPAAHAGSVRSVWITWTEALLSLSPSLPQSPSVSSRLSASPFLTPPFFFKNTIEWRPHRKAQ